MIRGAPWWIDVIQRDPLSEFVRRAGRLADAIGRLSGRIAGCGCGDDDPETCAQFAGGEWCECSDCHRKVQ